jgi:hypothetical protein
MILDFKLQVSFMLICIYIGTFFINCLVIGSRLMINYIN